MGASYAAREWWHISSRGASGAAAARIARAAAGVATNVPSMLGVSSTFISCCEY